MAELFGEVKSAGTFEVTFNRSGLASAIYITTLRVNSAGFSIKNYINKMIVYSRENTKYSVI